MRAFTLFIHHRGSSTPSVQFELAPDLMAMRELAQRTLDDSGNRSAVEVREDDELVLSLDRTGADWRLG